MKVGILTINIGLMNYGNRLQNYALQIFLEGMGADIQTIKYHPSYGIKTEPKVYTVKRIMKGINRRVLWMAKISKTYSKKKKWDQFVNGCIKWTSDDYYIDSDFSVLAEQFDYMIAGSDQIWNPYWEGKNPVYFMGFMPLERRISYAASFGVSYIPEEQREYFQLKLQAIPFISVREDKGAEIVKNLIGREVVQVIDPVFLLTCKQWETIAKAPKRIGRKPYLLVYLLGDCIGEMKEFINNYTNKNKLRVIYLDRYDKATSVFADPGEFVYLVMNAETVLTDSFHGAAFSIMFHRKIIYWNRSLNNGAEQDMSSRLASVFKLFGYIKDNSELKSMYRIFDCNDGECIDQIIREERHRAQVFLKEAMNCGGSI